MRAIPIHKAPILGVAVLAGLWGCASQQAWTPRLSLPSRHTVTRGQLVIHSDFPLAADHRLIEELIARRDDLCRHLDLPISGAPIEVYLFENAEAFNGFIRLHFPSFPPRRAYFVENDTGLAVYAQWGDRVGEDLRHEVTHGYLHAVVPSIPLWLDEGLAEYYECPRGTQGYNPEHITWFRPRLAEGSWRPDLSRLERFDPATDMNGADYAEAWGWVHFLLHSRPEHRDLLRGYLADLRRDGKAEPLTPRLRRLLADPNGDFLEHMVRLTESAAPQK